MLTNKLEGETMKVAIIHDWLVTYAGAEKVLEELINLYPDADLYSVVDFLPDNKRDFIKNKKVNTTFIQRLPFAKKKYRNYLSLMPLAIEQFDLSSYDLILSSSYAVAKGVITGPNQVHISYTHSPIRYAWDLQHQYLKESNLETGLKGWIAKWMLGNLRVWDYRTASGVDYFIANSNFIAKRIWKVYRREAKVIYPPVDTSNFEFSDQKEDFYITLSRMVPYKKMDLIVEAFSLMPQKKLLVIGSGPDFEKIKSKAGSNVELLGYQSQENVVALLKKARAFVFAAEEDFGISVVEAQASGTPVIAYGKGGALESVIGLGESPNPTGLFFKEQTTAAIIEAIQKFEDNEHLFQYKECYLQAQRFSKEAFLNDFKTYVASVLSREHGRDSTEHEEEYDYRRPINVN